MMRANILYKYITYPISRLMTKQVVYCSLLEV